MEEKNKIAIVLSIMVFCVFMFMLGSMLVDYAASLNNLKGTCGYYALQSLVFKELSIRVVYHAGVVIELTSMLTLCFLIIYLVSERFSEIV